MLQKRNIFQLNSTHNRQKQKKGTEISLYCSKNMLLNIDFRLFCSTFLQKTG